VELVPGIDALLEPRLLAQEGLGPLLRLPKAGFGG
jgi:hypothetical protein